MTDVTLNHLRSERDDGRIVRLELPQESVEPEARSEKWLLALWQASKKRTWSLWRSRAAISLEYVVQSGNVHYQCYFADPLLSHVTRSILRAHFDGLETTITDSIEFNQQLARRAGVSVVFQLRSAGWVEMADHAAPQGVLGLLGALSETRDAGTGLVQLLLQPTWMTTDDGRQPAFWLAGRVVAAASRREDAWRQAQSIAASFGQFAGFNGFRFARPRTLTGASLKSVVERRWPRRPLPIGPIATARQVASLYHPPKASAAIPNLATVTYRRTPSRVLPTGVSLGEGRDRQGRPCQVRVNPDDLLRHAFVLGPSGAGKSTLLAHLARELTESGHGITVIDPHGSLVKTIARTLPPRVQEKASLLRLSDTTHAVNLNPFRASPGYEFVTADEIVEVVQRIYGREYWGPLLDLTLRHATIATIEIGGSLIETARFLDDPLFRERAISQVRNPETVRFLSRLEDGNGLDRRSLPAVHRLQRLLATPWLRNTLGQTGQSLDFGEVFRRGDVLLIDLSGIGTANAKLLGSLILLMIRQATLGRGDVSASDARHFVIVDEASWFISRTVGELFDQARKFGVGLLLAAQRLGQLTPEDTRQAVLANAGTLVSFRMNDREEAAYLARHFAGQRLGASDLHHLPPYEAYVQMSGSSRLPEPAWTKTPPPAPEPARASEIESRLERAGRERYAKPWPAVERALHERERLLTGDDEPEVRTLAPPATVPAYAAGPSHH